MFVRDYRSCALMCSTKHIYECSTYNTVLLLLTASPHPTAPPQWGSRGVTRGFHCHHDLAIHNEDMLSYQSPGTCTVRTSGYASLPHYPGAYTCESRYRYLRQRETEENGLF